MFYSSYPCQQPSFSISNTIKSTNNNNKNLKYCSHFAIQQVSLLKHQFHPMAIWPLTKMINKRTKKTNHLHLVIISPILFSQYVLHPVFISIKIITNKRTDKGDCLHFAIISPSFFFKVLHPVFIPTYQNNY